MAKVLEGKPVAEALSKRSHDRTEALRARGIEPVLATVRVGVDSSSFSYERGIRKRAAEAGVALRSCDVSADSSALDLAILLDTLNADDAVHGILLFRPLPKTVDEQAICSLIRPEKDVDAANPRSLAGVLTATHEGFTPCTPQAVCELLSTYGYALEGKRVCVVGRSAVVGKPLAALLLERNATVTIAHSRTQDLADVTKQADIVVLATGRPRTFGATYFCAGQTVIDVGITWDERAGRVVGDVDFDAVAHIVDAITPVPGGIGAITSAVVISHVVDAAERALR